MHDRPGVANQGNRPVRTDRSRARCAAWSRSGYRRTDPAPHPGTRGRKPSQCSIGPAGWRSATSRGRAPSTRTPHPAPAERSRSRWTTGETPGRAPAWRSAPGAGPASRSTPWPDRGPRRGRVASNRSIDPARIPSAPSPGACASRAILGAMKTIAPHIPRKRRSSRRAPPRVSLGTGRMLTVM